MSYNEMKALAVHVAVSPFGAYNGVTKMDREDIEYMIHEFGWETVSDFFELYQRIYHVDVSKQLEWIEEIVQEMN